MWTLIPQLFYDFLARIIPGATLALVTALVIFSPSATVKFILNSENTTKLFSAIPLLFGFILSYLIGLVMGQIWELLIGRFTKDIDKDRKSVV